MRKRRKISFKLDIVKQYLTSKFCYSPSKLSLKISNVKIIFACVLLFTALAGKQASAFYNNPMVVLSISSSKLVLEDKFDGYKFRLILKPGKIIVNEGVKFEARAIKIDKNGEEIGSPKPVEFRFTRAFKYIKDEKKAYEAKPFWIIGDEPGLLGFSSVETYFKNRGDYIVDMRVKDENDKFHMGSFIVTTVKMLRPGETPKYEGYKLCQWCHYVQVRSWLNGAKAKAFDSLKAGVKKEAKIKAGLDPNKDYTRDTECLPCHTTGYKEKGGFKSIEETPDMAGVQCEACHGPGGKFTWVMKRKFAFAHSEVDDLGHVRYTDHLHSPKGHKYVYSPRKMRRCKELCHNENSPTYKPLTGSLKSQAERGGHKIFGLKNKHWFWDGVGHHMKGLPYYLHDTGVKCVLVFSVFMVLLSVFKRPSEQKRKYFRINLFGMRSVKAFFKGRIPRFIFQSVMVFFFFLAVAAGFYGYDVYMYNFATIAVWTTWWAGIVFLVVIAGTAWCMVCPWDAVASWFESLSLWKKGKSSLSLGLKWPKFLSNSVPAIFLFSLLTWLELGFHITKHPKYTAIVTLIMVVLALAFILVYEKKIFCKYICFVGRICGAYAMFAPIELRSKKKKVCGGCKGKFCYNGSDKGHPCPTGLCMETMDSDMYCTLCGECVKSCPNNNITLYARSFGRGILNRTSSFRWDEISFMLILLALTLFHGISMTPNWGIYLDALKMKFHLTELQAFSLSMLSFEIITMIVFFVVGTGSFALNIKDDRDFKSTMTIYACIAIIIAIAYHLAHSSSHFFMEGIKILPTLSDPFGFGWDLFGTANIAEVPILNQDTIWNLQAAFVMLGHFFAVLTSFKLFRHKKENRINVALIISIVLISALSMFEFWLLSLPMAMRTTM